MKRTNVIRNLSLSLLLAASAFAAPAYAQVSFNISIAPPAPQYEVVPILQPGYVWAPGYWGWNGDRHIWVRGRTIMQREGYSWAPDRWDQRNNNYYRTAGHWEHDNGYKPVKMKKEHWDNGNHGNNGKGNNGHGKGGKHDD
jgi:WXXGXW repeat (2 copies)